MRVSPYVIISGSLYLISFGCRDIQPVFVSQQISGYFLRGVVTTASGHPVDSLDVILYYNYTYIGSTPLDTVSVSVPDTSTLVNIAVYTRKDEFVRTLFAGTMPYAGTVPSYRWNGLDADGDPVPSGLYKIRYSVGSIIVKNTPYVIGGHPTARTDSTGHFIITNDNLPIGERFDASSSDIPAVGVYQVTPQITVQLSRNTTVSSYISLWLMRNEVTYHTFTF